MSLNPLDQLNSPNKNPQQNKYKPKDSLLGKGKFKANPLLKELRGLIICLVFVVILLVASVFTLFSPTSDFSLNNLIEGSKESKAIEENLIKQTKTIADSETKISNLNLELSNIQEALNNSNMTRTPLSQGYYFIAYFDSLVKKYNINLIDLSVSLSDETGEEFPLTEEIPQTGNYDLLPVKVEFESTFENMRKLFDEFYTKRLVYDENLVITNNFDGTVNVNMVIKFEKGGNDLNGTNTQEQTTGQEVIQVQQVQPVQQPTETEVLEQAGFQEVEPE